MMEQIEKKRKEIEERDTEKLMLKNHIEGQDQLIRTKEDDVFFFFFF
jgi:hypothetical protein